MAVTGGLRMNDPTSDNVTEERDFDPVWYLQANPDVRALGLDPLEHFQRTGRREGRLGYPVRALDLEHMLWRGYHETALPDLNALLHEGAPRERAGAGWALARWAHDQGDLTAALAAIKVFHSVPPEHRVIRHAGPYLLAVQLALAAGQSDWALEVLADCAERFGEIGDVALARLLCDQDGGDDTVISAHLARLYAPDDLAPVAVGAGEGSRFDRLCVVTKESAGGDKIDPNQRDRVLPLVSVIVPVFNGASGLRQALAGLEAQDWQALEVLIVDDGSTDASAEIAEDFARRDPRFQLIRLDENQGAYPARNVGMARARGNFITVHDADDWSHPAKIAAQVQALIDDPDLVASVSHWLRAGSDLGMTLWRIENSWIYRNVSSLMIRADLRDRLGYWDRVRFNADTEYYYRIIAVFGAGAITEVHPGVPLSFGRTDPGSLTMQSASHFRTQFFGLRRDYMEAAHFWHDRAGQAEGLYLPQHPRVRPFHVPKAMDIGDPQGPRSDFDIISASSLFDAQWYRLSHLDVLRADVSAARHYLEGGAKENRDPGPLFSTGGYRLAQGLREDQVPLLHWEVTGAAAGAVPLPHFSGALADQVGIEYIPRVLIFAHQTARNLFGAERSLLDVVGRMAGRGLCPVVVLPALRNPEYLAQLRQIAFAVETLPQLWRHGQQQPQPETVEAIRGLIRKYQARQVHVNTLVLDAPLIAARAEGCESTVHVRELPDQDAALCRNLGLDPEVLRRQLLEQADRFAANSEPVARWLGCPERTVIRPNSVDELLFGLSYVPDAVLRVALISSNIAKKGVADFIEVARLVESSGQDVQFVLIGPPTSELHLLRPWPDNVKYAGYADTPVEAVGQVDLVLSLSHFAESFGRTVVEAMAAGRPVICYDRGAPPTLLQSGHTGFVVPADDPRGVADAVLALAAARGQLSAMSAAARAQARAIQDMAMLA